MDNVQEIIDEKLSNITDSQLRIALQEALRGVIQHQTEMNKALIKRVEDEIRDCRNLGLYINNLWSIQTVFVPYNKVDVWEQSGFYDISIGSSVFYEQQLEHFLDMDFQNENRCEQYFLNCKYEDFDGYLNKTYKVVCTDINENQIEKECTLCLNSRLVKHEEDLFKVAILYGVNKPVLFSPWARRAVDVIIKGNDGGQIKSVNSIEGVPLIVGQLMWNIEKTPKDVDGTIQVASDGGHKIYEYSFDVNIKNTDFVISDESIRNIVKNDNSIVLQSDNELNNCFTKYRLHNSIAIEKHNMFANHGLDMASDKVRLRTRADINYVLKGLSNNLFICELVGLTNAKGYSLIEEYRKEHSYYCDSDNLFYKNRRKLLCCYVMFSGMEQFVTDYANYVLHYLNCNYPDYSWVGVKK